MPREISFYLCDQRIYFEMAPEFNLQFAFSLSEMLTVTEEKVELSFK